MPQVIELWKELMDFHRDFDPLFTRSPEGASNFQKFILENMNSDDSRMFVAEEQDGKLVGYLKADVAKYPPVFEKAKYGLIADIAVTASRRRDGIGKILVDTAAKWFLKKGISRMEMRLVNANPVSTAFWAKMGFKPYISTLFRDIGD